MHGSNGHATVIENRIEQCCAGHIVHSCQQYCSTLSFLKNYDNFQGFFKGSELLKTQSAIVFVLFSIQYHVTIIDQLNDLNVTRYYIINN